MAFIFSKKPLIWMLLAVLLLTPAIHAYVLPSPSGPAVARQTPTKSSAVVESDAQPTTPPTRHRLAARDLQQTLSLYINWQSACNNNGKGGNDNAKQGAVSVNANIQQLWKTVTETINCGHGTVITVTETVTATSTTTAPGNAPTEPPCDQACWDGYLWHTYGYGISVAQALTGIVCILIGIYFLVFGFRSFRYTLALTGFVFFAVMVWIGLTNNEPAGGYVNNDILYCCVCAGLGIVGAVLCAFMFSISIYLIGGLGGFFFAVWILAWKASLVITVKVAYICFIVGVGVVASLLVYLLETYIIIAATSFTGAYLVIFGLDFFAHTGFLNAWLFIFDANPNHFNAYMIQTKVLVMMAFVAVFFLGSCGWQYYYNCIRHERTFGVNLVPKKEEK